MKNLWVVEHYTFKVKIEQGKPGSTTTTWFWRPWPGVGIGLEDAITKWKKQAGYHGEYRLRNTETGEVIPCALIQE